MGDIACRRHAFVHKSECRWPAVCEGDTTLGGTGMSLICSSFRSGTICLGFTVLSLVPVHGPCTFGIYCTFTCSCSWSFIKEGGTINISCHRHFLLLLECPEGILFHFVSSMARIAHASSVDVVCPFTSARVTSEAVGPLRPNCRQTASETWSAMHTHVSDTADAVQAFTSPGVMSTFTGLRPSSTSNC